MIGDRIRKVDVNTLPIEQVEDISKQLGETVNTRLHSVKTELDQILKIYGLKIDINFQINHLDGE